MSRVFDGFLFAMLMPASALAISTEIDTDGDGVASLAEIQAFYPEVTEELFEEIDLDGDGYVNDEEFLAAIGAELIPDTQKDLWTGGFGGSAEYARQKGHCYRLRAVGVWLILSAFTRFLSPFL